ncbi:hypothetical protein ACFY36_43860 [Actinoplanes sp. NPDC000266]
MTDSGTGLATSGRDDSQNKALAVAGVVLAVAVMVIQPSLPYEIDSMAGMVLFLCVCAAAVWSVHLGLNWWRHRRRPRGIRRAAVLTMMLSALFVTVALPAEETGTRKAYCQFGVHGLGRGMVWVKVETREPGKDHRLTISWGGWIGRSRAMPLYRTTYFTFLKRDFYSPAESDVSVDRDATITCGDGRPPPDEDQVHLDGADWEQKVIRDK